MSSSIANSKKCRAAQGLSGVLLAVWRSKVSRSPPRRARRTVSVLCLGLQVAAEISEYSLGSSAGSTPCCLPPTEAFVVKGRFFHLHTCHKRNFFSTQPLVSMVTFGAGSCRSASLACSCTQRRAAHTEHPPYHTVPHFTYLVVRCFVSTVSALVF